MYSKKLALCFVTAGYLMVCGTSARALEVSQNPLFLGTDVPGNLVFTPSVEWPTIVSVANLQTNYTPATEFVGYFDPNKCYEYRHSGSESDRHFYPAEAASGRECDGYWSGNFLNWAATQTIDPFRKVLTGGLRVRDTPTETWLEKARHTGQGGTGIYPNRTINNTSILRGATPFQTASSMRMRIEGLGNRMRFRLNGTNVGSATPFNPAVHPPGDPDDLSDDAYDVAIRVAVCVAGLEEDNCVAYGSSAKPEGLIQANYEQLRYSVFGYLNQDGSGRDGAALRARQKFVGPTLPGGGNNEGKEWDPSTGVLFRNPDNEDASDTSAQFGITIQDSGVINYINKFGQLTNNNHKSQDPVSELFYAAVRYIRGESNVNAYTNGTTYDRADGFPVITDWDKNGHDPVQYSCQINVALGIGDIYTHRDKNLPGPTSGSDEPSKPAAVSSDDWINVVEVGQRIDAMEGGSTSLGSGGGSWTGRNNSGYIASLAYWANTTDMRPDEPGKTTMSTHWVDVLEAQSLETIPYNQYILATKYGGADVPETFDPMTDTLEQDWWHTNGETLSPFGGRGRGQTMPKPDNYFLAGDAASMIEALSDAFETILSETTNVVTSVATTSTRLDTDSLAIQARFESDFWSGDLLGLDPITNAVQWRASDYVPSPGLRKILSWNPDAPGLGAEVPFTTSMPATMKTRIASSTNGQPIDQVIDFLRGDRTNEASGFRLRGDSVLGDIINSRPVLAGASNEGWSRIDNDYGEVYLDTKKSVRTPVVYVGGNDGMLHGFNAGTGAGGGTETMAYVPGAVLDRIGSLANPTYQHRFFVDGQIAIADAQDGTEWKNVLVGGLGAGGKAIYALDVTTPGSESVLWEISSEDHPELGYTFGKPVINRIGDQWYAIFGNGYGSDGGQAHMFFVNLFSGVVARKLPLGAAGGNGLSGVAAFSDPETGTELIRAYAGDLNGTIWRVDLGAGLPTGPATGFANGLFTDPDARPITASPVLAASPSGGLVVYVGSGKLIETVDRTDSGSDPEVFWALIDRNSPISGTGGLNAVSMSVSGGQRVIQGTPGDDGWFLDLTTGSLDGERVLNQARVIFGQLIFTTFEPDDDACATGGQQRIYVLDAVSGSGRLDNQCNNCGVIEIGIGAPVEPPVVLKPPVSPELTPGDPGGVDPDDPDGPDLPDGSSVGAVTGWCSAFGVLSPSGFLPLGNICDGRQVWRQVR